MSLAQPPPPHNATGNRSYAKRISTASDSDSAEESAETLLDTPEKEKLPQLPLPHSGLNLKSVLKFTLVLFLATLYLTFCMIVNNRTIQVPFGSNGVVSVGLPFFHVSVSTAAGITTIAILIIKVALWPIKGLIDEIRSEEFFRLLRTYPKGMPLESVNAISVPTTGAFDIFLATFHRHCSPLLISTLATTFLITATSVLAPSALNAASIVNDVVDPAFQVGAILNSSMITGNLLGKYLPLASASSWVENVLNLTTTYSRVISSEDDPLGYVVPFPPGFTTAMQAQWTTDIIVLNPSCNWYSPNTTVLDDGETVVPEWTVTLPEANINVVISSDMIFVSGGDTVTTSIASDYSYNTGTSTSVSDGCTVFVISQSETAPTQSTDLSKIPTLRFSNGINVAFLVCSSHASIQTRRVWATGNGIFTLGQHQPSRGNLDLSRVNDLLGTVLNEFATTSGPLQVDVGTDMMVRLIFGNNFQFWSSTPPAPLTNITNVYKQIIQSATKVFISGAFDVASVTGGYPKEQVVFKSSLGHVIASVILFALLTTGFVGAQFRKGRDAFTLVDVAAALADSDAPQKFVEMKQRVDAGERRILRFVQSDKGDWVVLLGASDASESTED